MVGWATGHPFGLDLDPFSALALTASVIHSNFITSDATSHCGSQPLGCCMSLFEPHGAFRCKQRQLAWPVPK